MQTLKTRSDTYFFAEIPSVSGVKWGTNNFLQKLWKEKDNTMKLSYEQKEVEYLYIYLFVSMLQVKAWSAHMNFALSHKSKWKL